MKRILVVICTDSVPFGGLTTVMMNYYRNMDRDGLVIDFASTNNAPRVLLDELQSNGNRYYNLGQRKCILTYFFNLYRVCRNYDIIHVNGNSATTVIEHFAAYLAGIKYRINHNHTSIPDHKKLSDFVYPLFKKLVTNRVACSDLAGGWLYRDEKFVVLRNAIDVDKYQYNINKRKAYRLQFNISEDCVVFGHLGKIYKPKNHPYLLKIFAEFHKRVQNSVLFLVGDGEMREEIERQIDLLNIRDNVIFAGLRTDVAEMLQVMDFFVFPSIWEGMPLSLLEAASSGLPCFISDSITKDVQIGPNIQALSIKDEPVVWANYINEHLPKESREVICSQNAKLISEAGFNIKTATRVLEKIYKS